jgi:hypothetical protein
MTTERKTLASELKTMDTATPLCTNKPVENEVADHLETSRPTIPDDDPSSSMSLSSLKQELDVIHKDTKVLFEDHMQFTSIPFPARDLDKLRTNVDLSWSFVFIIEHLQHNDYARAKMEIQRAVNLAHAVDDKHSIARCNYWLGRIALQRGRFGKAYSYFHDAKPDLNGRVSSEAENVDFYLMLCTPGMSTEYRTQLLREYSQSVTNKYINGEDEVFPNSPWARRHQNPRKRKRELRDITVALRPAKLSSSCHRRSLNLKMTQRPPPARKVVWMIRNTDDLDTNRKQEPYVSINISTDETTAAVEDRKPHTRTTNMNFPILEARRRKFTFRCYPIGLSGPRTRHINIFSRQPGEPALSIEEGQRLEAAMKKQKITMRYLERESEFLSERATVGTLQDAALPDETTDSDSMGWGTEVGIIVEVQEAHPLQVDCHSGVQALTF